MNNELIIQGLRIAAIGMGLVFLVIIFLWGLMALLMRLTSRGETPEDEALPGERTDQSLIPKFEATERQRRAAAAAVAVSLAMAFNWVKAGEPLGGGPKDEVSAWQAFHRSRQTNPEQRRG